MSDGMLSEQRRRGLAWFLASLIVLAGMPVAAVEPGASEECARGRAALTDGDFAEAVRLLEAAVKGTPDDLDCRFLLSRAYEADGKPRRAAAQLAEIVRRQPRHREAAVVLARRAFERNKFSRVVELLEPLRRRSDSLETCRMLGTAWYREGKLDDARRILTTALGRKGARAGDYELLGDIAMAQERFAIAVEKYAEALRRGSGGAAPHLKLARAYWGRGDYLGETARRVLQGGESGALLADGYVLDRVPGQPDVFVVSSTESAIFHAHQALKLGSNTTETRLLLGDVWLGARRWRRATAEYRRIKDQVPDAKRAAYFHSYARAVWGMGDVEGFVSRMERAAELDRATYGPLLGRAYVDAAEWYNQEGHLPKYIEYMRRAVARAPGSSELRYRLGNALGEHGRWDDAVLQWRIALELRPDHPDRARMLGLIRSEPPSSSE